MWTNLYYLLLKLQYLQKMVWYRNRKTNVNNKENPEKWINVEDVPSQFCGEKIQGLINKLEIIL